MNLKQRFGANVREQRKRLNVSQGDLSFRIGADQAYVSRIERGLMNVTLETVEQIAIALGIEIETLLALPARRNPDAEAPRLLLR